MVRSVKSERSGDNPFGRNSISPLTRNLYRMTN